MLKSQRAWWLNHMRYSSASTVKRALRSGRREGRNPGPARDHRDWVHPQVRSYTRGGPSTVSGSTVIPSASFRALAIVDDYSRECPAIEVDTSMGSARVVGVLERLAETRGLPEVITVDHGPEFAGKVMDELGIQDGRQIELHPAWQGQ